MDALKDLNPETKISELTVGEFEAVMTRALCRAADFAAVRFAQEQQQSTMSPIYNEQGIERFNTRRAEARQVQDAITGEDWPSFSTPYFKNVEKPEAEQKT